MSAREVALGVVRDVFPRGGRARGAHEAFDYRVRLAGLDDRDRAFAAELAYGAIKARRRLDWLLGPYVGDRAESLPPTILEILRLGVYQLRFMHVEARAAVSESVALAKKHGHRGTAGLVNAVLRRVADEPERVPSRGDFPSDDEYLATFHSFPTWIVALARRVFGEDPLEPILAGMNAQARTALRVNLMRATVEEAIAALAERGVRAARSELVPEIVVLENGASHALLEDPALRWDYQGETAALPVDLLDPQPGEHVVELCSGRGNKTLQIAARMRDRGRIEAIERDVRKVKQAFARFTELGLGSVDSISADATKILGTDDAQSVLLDAACSGLGILGRQPEARWRKEPADAGRLAPLQEALLQAAARRTAPGGRLVYSVCSFDPREGHDRIAAFLAQHPQFRLRRAILIPPGIDRRDGFFIAVIDRTAQ